MLKRITTRERTVGPGLVARVPQEQTTSREFGTACLDRLGVLAERCGDGRGAELLTHGTRNLQDLALAVAQVLELQLDQAPQIIRNSRCDVLEPTGEGPFAIPLNQHAPRDEIVSDVDDEERIAFRSLVNRIRKSRRFGVAEVLGAELTHQIFADFRGSESAEPQETAMPRHRQLGKQSSERLIPWQTLDRAYGAHDQEPRGLPAPRDETKPVQRRCVAPLQILQA